MNEYQKWFTCCSCGISCQENEVDEVIDFEGKFDFMCHRCFHDVIGYDTWRDDEQEDDTYEE